MPRIIKTLLLVVCAAILLIFSFPKIEWWLLAWVAMVPLLIAIDGKKPWVAFGLSYLGGFLFFAGTLGWFVYVTYPGAAALIAFLSLYFAFFGLAYAYFRPLPLLPRLIVLASVWTVLEFIRSNLFTGFGWVTLGHSQYKNLWIVQIADITGVYGISFLVILVNLVIASSFAKATADRSPVVRDDRAELTSTACLVLALLTLSVCYGFYSLSKPLSSGTVKVGVVQPNIPLAVNWDENLHAAIVQKTIHLTKNLTEDRPDLIIWPETSLPGTIQENPNLAADVEHTAMQVRAPLLVGTMTQEGEHYYNSAYLIDSDGKIAGRYDKIHLVPFGEYLPLRPLLGWINRFVALDDFTSGHQYTIFPLGQHDKAFGVLICFEDSLSYLRRNFTKAGAQFFVNITNDAWFEDTKAPFLHMQAAAIGCVENRRALVRAANTGVSAFIDPYGRITATVHNDAGKKNFITGQAVASLPLSAYLSCYTKYGDIFTYLCFFVILGGILNLRKYKGKNYV